MTARCFGLVTIMLLLLVPFGAGAQEGGGEGGQGGAAAPPGPPPVNRKALRALKLRFEREPTIEEVQQASLTFFKVNPERVASYRRGATWKGIMPNIELIFNNEYGTNDRKLYDYLYQQMYISGDWPAKDDERVKRASLSLGVRASWSLDRLLFNAEVLDVSSLAGVQEGLLREVVSLYFTRRRLLVSGALNPPQTPNEQITEDLRLDEVTANLDALCGGYFSREIRRRNEEPPSN